MKKSLKLASLLTLVVALAVPSLFAESRHRTDTNAYRDDYRNGRGITVEGRVSDINRDRNGFVIELARSRYVLYTTDRRDLRNVDRGDYIRAYGYLDSRGVVHVRDIDVVRNNNRRNDRRY
jgi:hypothetical protein